MKNDKLIEQYRKEISKLRDSLTEKPKVSFTTKGIFMIEKTPVNINVIPTVQQCVEIAAYLADGSLAFNEANKQLGTDEPYLVEGYSIDDWYSDIKQRIALLRWQQEKTKLDKLDKKLEELLSEEAKANLTIKDIAKELGL